MILKGLWHWPPRFFSFFLSRFWVLHRQNLILSGDAFRFFFSLGLKIAFGLLCVLPMLQCSLFFFFFFPCQTFPCPVAACGHHDTALELAVE